MPAIPAMWGIVAACSAWMVSVAAGATGGVEVVVSPEVGDEWQPVASTATRHPPQKIFFMRKRATQTA
jgi:hypothetical protein